MCKSKSDYKYNVGDIIKDVVVIKRTKKIPIRKNNEKTYAEKSYICKCIKCGYEIEKYETQLTKKCGCPVCSSHIVLKGYNDIATTDNWMVKFFLNTEDAYKYKSGSNKKVDMVCSKCGNIKKEFIYVLKEQHGFSCPCCSDGISFPEKLLINLLKYLKIEYVRQYNIKKYKYDFFLPKFNSIIELHGKQHYDSGRNKNWKTYEEEHENDLIKYDLAVLNGFEHNKNYFVVDCFYSDADYIIKNLKKIKIFDKISYINDNSMKEILKKAEKSLTLMACELKNENNNLTSTDIASIIGVDRHTVRLYLKKGEKYGLCRYDAKEEKTLGRTKGLENAYQKRRTKIIVRKDGKFCGEFNSITELVNLSEDIFGVKFSQSRISKIKNTKEKSYGYNFYTK